MSFIVCTCNMNMNNTYYPDSKTKFTDFPRLDDGNKCPFYFHEKNNKIMFNLYYGRVKVSLQINTNICHAANSN